MGLSERLAFASVPRLREVPSSSDPKVASLTRHVFELTLATNDPAQSRGCVLPRGLERLRLPDASTLAEAVVHLDADAGAEPTEPPVVALDIETSGLAGAAIPFIVGVAWHTGADRVAVHQLTLTQASHERALLRQVAELVERVAGPRTRVVTFNGASFDLPVIRGRLQRLGLGARWLELPHVDLLHPARRLWAGRFTDCRQTTLEHRVLGMRRIGDMPGFEVAELFDRLQSHPDDPWLQDELERARLHNRGDLLGLLALTAAVAERIARPEDIQQTVGAARHLVARGQLGVAVQHLQAAVPLQGDVACDDPDAMRQAAHLLAELLRRDGQHDGAARVWRFVCERWPGDPRAHEALAKHLEHRERRPAQALEVAAGSASPCPRRLMRLRAKAGALM